MKKTIGMPGLTGGTPRWHVLFTRNQHEKLAAWSLTSKNFDVYLPLYSSLRRWQDRFKSISLPLFPGYVFVKEGMDRQVEILTTPGVVQIVGWGGNPAVVADAEIESVKRIIESRLVIESLPYIECGDRVRVVAGPLAGLEGVLRRKKGLARFVVSIEMLGRSAAVEIDISNVGRVGPSQATAQPGRVLVAQASVCGG
jgi:transcription antitermination factor NusG